MNPNYTHTITLYNCLRASDNAKKTDVWYRKVIHNCYYKSLIDRVESGKGLQMTNVYTVRIPSSNNYRPYHQWILLDEQDREQFFTLKPDDIVIHGECKDEIGANHAISSAQLLNKYKPESFRITAISDNTKAIAGKHYRLGG
ncbi:hypothetical protein NE683_12330 [Bariatricus massiliensis]|uniref:Uncharacterized protein n=1 Tax=Bariatricus massiliensis TaxID=1745713 RepID=A0ABS8DH17_9FIRM|nr:DUF6751 family protein [Bariatricus massiliensis]MCB7306183.1 hypothetical protein [Bariatricus massiliensis]MCB7375261.1 hypothetical protein [Bariatricus massiliensis]MCB7387721.1 hypothetical protein [Bariatricus massiliensis]MCB7411882.1 hypothetical protein [Bariatricus massiliensis]MCQ5254018.1 hypothetical protein [Bariatricus massiliensis]